LALIGNRSQSHCENLLGLGADGGLLDIEFGGSGLSHFPATVVIGIRDKPYLCRLTEWLSIRNASRQCYHDTNEPPHSARKHECGGLICKDQSVFAHALRDCRTLSHVACQNVPASIFPLPITFYPAASRLAHGHVAVMGLLDCDLQEMVEFTQA